MNLDTIQPQATKIAFLTQELQSLQISIFHHCEHPRITTEYS